MNQPNLPHILVSNDDGIHAPGLAALIEALSPLGIVTAVAPDGPRSGASSSITSLVPLTIKQVNEGQNFSLYSTTGTPADCIKLALNVLFSEKLPDLVVTGINHGRNDGVCVLYSGTIGAALEATIAGIPALAVSVNDHGEDANMRFAAGYAHAIAEQMLHSHTPLHTMLSLNLPKEEPKGLKVCKQAVGKFVNEYSQSENGRGKKVYWMVGHQVKTVEDEATDLDFLQDGFATLTPIQIDLTNHGYLNELRTNMEHIAPQF